MRSIRNASLILLLSVVWAVSSPKINASSCDAQGCIDPGQCEFLDHADCDSLCHYAFNSEDGVYVNVMPECSDWNYTQEPGPTSCGLDQAACAPGSVRYWCACAPDEPGGRP